MGEARRRRKLGVFPKGLGELIRGELLPDFGTYYFKEFGEKPLIIYIEHPRFTYNKRDGYIHFVSSSAPVSYMGLILTSIEIAKKYPRHKPFHDEIIPCPEESFVTQDANELVLPFRRLRRYSKIETVELSQV